MENKKVENNISFEKCNESLPITKQEFNDTMEGIKDEIGHWSSSLESGIENWIDTNLNYIYENINCICTSSGKIAKTKITLITSNHKHLKRKFESIQIQNTYNKNKLQTPFETRTIIYVENKLLPLVTEIDMLRDEVVQISKKMYKF